MKLESALLKEFRANMPDAGDISKTAINKILKSGKTRPAHIKKNFSSFVEGIQKDAYRIYLAKEKGAWKKAIRKYCHSNSTHIMKSLENGFDEFDTFFLSLSQSRRARAGSTFEEIIRSLFRALKYPFDEQQIINGKPDFLMPGRAYYEKNAPECIVFTAKRTLRERWRQITIEGTKARGFFLATIDDAVSENALAEMKNNKIYLVVPATLKKKTEPYKNALNVITFEDFFEDYLDPAMKRWKKAGVI